MNSTTFVGNLTKDPIVKTSAAGKNRALISVAVNEGDKDKGNEKTHFIDVTVFGEFGDNVAASLKSGQRVVVSGRFDTYQSEVQINGEDKKINRVAFVASAIGPDLRWQTAQVSKAARTNAAPAASAPAAAPAAAATEDF